MRGKFVAIEGGDGSGKDTHIERLKVLYPEAIFTREPGGTRIGNALREMLLHASHGPVSLPAEFFLFMADRAQNVEEIIKPALAAGKVVVSHRSWLSFIAYQVYGREQLDWKPLLESAIEKIYADCPIDLVIVLDVPFGVGRERQRKMGKVLDTMESMPKESHDRIRKAYLDLAKAMPAARFIDANRPVEEVWKDVKKAVASILQ